MSLILLCFLKLNQFSNAPTFPCLLEMPLRISNSIMKKPLLYGLMLASSIWCFSGVTDAQTKSPSAQEKAVPTGDLTKQVRIQVEFIDVSHEQLTELMFGEKVAANDGELRKQVAQLVKDGKATIAETMLCVAQDKQKASTESIEELIYPTEYEPATVTNGFPAKDDDLTKPARADAVGPLPTAFDTRNLGATLEVEPHLSQDSKSVNLRIVPEIIYHVGNQVWAEWKDERSSAPVQMPLIYALRVNTSVTLTLGHYTLLAALSPKNKDGFPDFTRKLMVFVKADSVETGP